MAVAWLPLPASGVPFRSQRVSISDFGLEAAGRQLGRMVAARDLLVDPNSRLEHLTVVTTDRVMLGYPHVKCHA